MGCKAVTPHLVSLAKRLEGKPFHLVAAHCQRDTKENVVSYISGKGLAAGAPNFTVTSMGGHPKVKGNGYVPYYMVFDHHGNLAHQHMCGDYHGGDGLKMIDWVDKLLKATPEIYLGKEPYVHFDKLAKQISKKKNLPGALRELDKHSEATPGREQLAELARLKKAIVNYRDRMLETANEFMETDPTKVIGSLSGLSKEFKGSALSPEIDSKLSELRKSKELRTSIDLFKRYSKELRRLEKNPSPKMKKKSADKLEKLIAGKEDLPVTKTIRAKIEELRS
ncbi:MAG: TlpA family protein disulfide reductase [Planctomycetota bacterium]